VKPPERKAPSLKYIIGGLSVGILALPVACFLVVSFVLSMGPPKLPIIGLEYLSQELLSAIEFGEGRSISVRPAYRPPPGLQLIVEDADDRIILSTVDAFPIGGTVRLDQVAADIQRDASVSSLFAESMRSKGRVIGRYFAWFPKDSQPIVNRRTPIGLLALIGFVALAFSGGMVVATQLARAVLKLERAAERIAAGDLETVVDVGGIREIEDLGRAMDGMRAAIREERDQRARFLAAVSHDLRTPLTSIGGYLEAVDDGLADDPATLERYVTIMRDKTAILEHRISGLIEFARMETGEWRMRFEIVGLRAYLEELCRGFREDAALKGHPFSFELSALGSLRIAVDRALLARAFENLVSNALRYSPAGGAVRVLARVEGGAYILDFDDEGPGIAPSERERVFEAFVRGFASGGASGGASSGAGSEGSGLGLYIARSVIQGHGWSLRAEETSEGGGRLRVLIPSESIIAS
jgi:signal transduction histidine kinase